MRKVVTDYGLRITSVADSLNVGLAILPQLTIILFDFEEWLYPKFAFFPHW